MSGESEFVVRRLRAKPVEYGVKISHFVRDGQWVMGVAVEDVADNRETYLRVAADLRIAAGWIERGLRRRTRKRQPYSPVLVRRAFHGYPGSEPGPAIGR